MKGLPPLKFLVLNKIIFDLKNDFCLREIWDLKCCKKLLNFFLLKTCYSFVHDSRIFNDLWGWTASILKAHSSHTNFGYRHIHNGSHFMAHLRPWSTAPQPDGISWESMFVEGGKPEYPEKNPLWSEEPGSRSRVVEVGSASDDRYANLTPYIN